MDSCFFSENDFTPNKSIYQGYICYILGPLYTISGVWVGGALTNLFDKRYRLIVVWDFNRKERYVVYYTSNTFKCLCNTCVCCWTPTFWTWSLCPVFSIHCKTIHRLIIGPASGATSLYNLSRKLQASSLKGIGGFTRITTIPPNT